MLSAASLVDGQAARRISFQIESCFQYSNLKRCYQIYLVGLAAIGLTLGILTLKGLDPRILSGTTFGLGGLFVLAYLVSCIPFYKGCQGQNPQTISTTCAAQCIFLSMAALTLSLGAYTFTGRLNPNVLAGLSIAGGSCSVITLLCCGCWPKDGIN